MKIAIYGGTFSPPHIGHERVIETLFGRFRPCRMIIMPAGIPPHKSLHSGVSGALRLEMCRAAFENIIPEVEISSFELEKEGKSYSIDTVRHFAAFEDVTLFIGDDMLFSLDTWYKAEELFKECSFAAVPRHPDTLEKMRERARELHDKYGARITVFDTAVTEISSTEVREQIKRDGFSPYVRDGVMDIIRKNGLYGCSSAHETE